MASILLVDDDEYIRELYSELLTENGFKVDMAIDGIEGLKMVGQKQYDLILLDIMMPRMDGLMFMRKLKDLKLDSPIVIITNLDHAPIRQEVFRLGATDYLIKAEYNPKAITEKIKSYIKVPGTTV